MRLGQIKRATESLYTGTATVYMAGYEKGAHGAQERTRAVLFENIPCRLSYDRKVPNDQDTTGAVIQDVTMFCDPSYIIPPGSRVVITQNGRERSFDCSGQAAVYESHQEVELTVLREKA